MITQQKLYLCAYNAIQVLGWSWILYTLISHYGDSSSNINLWDKIWVPLFIFQSSAYLEVIHAITGLIRSNPMIILIQISSRVFICVILLSLPTDSIGSSIILPYTFISWCIAEITRYSYYFMNLIGYIPYFLMWLRYSLFMVLYPIGISGEILCIYKVIVHSMSNPKLWSYILPNQWNFTFSFLYMLIMVLIIYIPGSPMLYKHMFLQRQKMLNTKSKAEKVK
ncbi:very-long-chain (3R)-3-hydroxyacyl-CoA dehydratase hpo-8 [Vespa velutina]|uniref:very-long-chain (3R)-3-hydroxyacyl-CoA dehydratase hpo-8 n=1 Tax=Vespa velutina TaxID=202808 RepID=UPI001FB26200|nr:very-long-chain (3R)-3-hydroxyacyl-CoA dehydratase hpo-8 [Vespa velutina]XP_047358505.1 very-long-chain (3R)-3-hydroxyacyl-CoA dehydratase hpo-8 [Vespa velutina]XP_047358506.1 very-long-chain (3R)-3-hydroxyacyl-CoA dehydratase hpo-8 [Vespa velutina]